MFVVFVHFFSHPATQKFKKGKQKKQKPQKSLVEKVRIKLTFVKYQMPCTVLIEREKTQKKNKYKKCISWVG